MVHIRNLCAGTKQVAAATAITANDATDISLGLRIQAKPGPKMVAVLEAGICANEV